MGSWPVQYYIPHTIKPWQTESYVIASGYYSVACNAGLVMTYDHFDQTPQIRMQVGAILPPFGRSTQVFLGNMLFIVV